MAKKRKVKDSACDAVQTALRDLMKKRNRPNPESLKWALARWQNGNVELSYAFGVGQLAQALDIVVRELKWQTHSCFDKE